jgi:hypothetical protein
MPLAVTDDGRTDSRRERDHADPRAVGASPAAPARPRERALPAGGARRTDRRRERLRARPRARRGLDGGGPAAARASGGGPAGSPPGRRAASARLVPRSSTTTTCCSPGRSRGSARARPPELRRRRQQQDRPGRGRRPPARSERGGGGARPARGPRRGTWLSPAAPCSGPARSGPHSSRDAALSQWTYLALRIARDHRVSFLDEPAFVHHVSRPDSLWGSHECARRLRAIRPS